MEKIREIVRNMLMEISIGPSGEIEGGMSIDKEMLKLSKAIDVILDKNWFGKKIGDFELELGDDDYSLTVDDVSEAIVTLSRDGEILASARTDDRGEAYLEFEEAIHDFDPIQLMGIADIKVIGIVSR